LKRNYDTIALFYDRLAGLVYGKALVHARAFLLTGITPGSTILIAGGGTGWELEAISKLFPSGLIITYVDASAKMTALAAKRNIAGNKVAFITAPIENALLDKRYDFIITPFLFDNFSDKSLQQIFPLLHNRLKPGGLWLHCDFLNTNVLWQRALLKIMYRFFRICCGIEATRLPDTEGCFAQYNYQVLDQKFFIGEFITAVHYKKAP